MAEPLVIINGSLAIIGGTIITMAGGAPCCCGDCVCCQPAYPPNPGDRPRRCAVRRGTVPGQTPTPVVWSFALEWFWGQSQHLSVHRNGVTESADVIGECNVRAPLIPHQTGTGFSLSWRYIPGLITEAVGLPGARSERFYHWHGLLAVVPLTSEASANLFLGFTDNFAVPLLVVTQFGLPPGSGETTVEHGVRIHATAAVGECPTGFTGSGYIRILHNGIEIAHGEVSFSVTVGLCGCPPVPPDPRQGACCRPDGTCIQTTLAYCQYLHGIYRGDFTTCTPSPCPPPQIASCCLPGGGCAMLSQTACDALGGAWRFGQDCDVPCDFQPLGACCYPSGQCDITTAQQCSGAFGTWQGAGTTCAGVNCGTGACCYFLVHGGWRCEQQSQAQCANLFGTFYGLGSVCDGRPCPPPDPLGPPPRLLGVL